jgi:arsenate reductase
MKIQYEDLAIVATPPSEKELKRMLEKIKSRGGSIKNLFNTSGQMYRELKIADRLKAGLSEMDAIKLLSTNGKLIKRPFLLTSDDGVVGFKAEEWKKLFRARPAR